MSGISGLRGATTGLRACGVAAAVLDVGDKATLVLVLGYCGLRWGEAIELRVEDLDMLRRRISVTINAVEVDGVIEIGTPKTHKRRSAPFPELLGLPLARLCEGKGPDDPVFADEQGHHLRRTRTNEAGRCWFTRAVVRAGLPPMTPHDLRHTAASLAVSSGANVEAVQRLVGHASASMTLGVYSDLLDDDLEAVAGHVTEGLALTDVGRMWTRGGD